MALSDDLRELVVGAVVEGSAAAQRFGVSIASAVRWVGRFKAKGGLAGAQRPQNHGYELEHNSGMGRPIWP